MQDGGVHKGRVSAVQVHELFPATQYVMARNTESSIPAIKQCLAAVWNYRYLTGRNSSFATEIIDCSATVKAEGPTAEQYMHTTALLA